MIELLESLVLLYEKLSCLTREVISFPAENPCRECHLCCSYPICLQVSAFELSLISENVTAFSKDDFVQFINRRFPEGSVCPNYDLTSHMCRIYPYRPMCCRVFGYVPFRTLNKDCVFFLVNRNKIQWNAIEEIFCEFIALRMKYFRLYRDSIKLETVVDLLTMGDVLIEEGKVEKGFSLFDRALIIDEKSASVHSHLAKKFEMVDELKEAENSYRKAVELDPEDPVLLIKLGFVLHNQGKHRDAITLYKETLHKFPGNHMAYGNMGLAYAALNEMEDALDTYSNACAAAPTNTTFRIMKGNILNRLGRVEEAIQEYSEALKLDSCDNLLHMCIASVYKKKGRHREALYHFSKCLELSDSEVVKDLVQREIDFLKEIMSKVL